MDMGMLLAPLATTRHEEVSCNPLARDAAISQITSAV